MILICFGLFGFYKYHNKHNINLNDNFKNVVIFFFVYQNKESTDMNSQDNLHTLAILQI